MDVGELKAVIMREEKPVPEGDENNAQYKERLKEVSRECCMVLNVCQYAQTLSSIAAVMQ